MSENCSVAAKQTISVVQFNTSGSNQPETLSYSFYIHLKAEAASRCGICSFLLSVSRAEIRESVIMGKPFFCILLFLKSDVSGFGSTTGNDGKVTDLNRLLWSNVLLNLCRGGVMREVVVEGGISSVTSLLENTNTFEKPNVTNKAMKTFSTAFYVSPPHKNQIYE